MAAGAIRTPDQRLRVFISSTLGELADERRAARSSVEQLRLAPVLFELGARPHPPRALDRSYLAQSDAWRSLQEVFDCFTEGFDTPPLVAARAALVRAAT